MKRKLLLFITLVLIILAATRVSFLLLSRNALPKTSLNRFAAVGEGVAEETAKRLGNKGKVLVIEKADSSFGNGVEKARLAHFQKIAEKNGLTVAAIEKLPAGLGLDYGIPTRNFSEIISKHRDVDAIVSFAGAPNLKEKDIDALGQMPKVFVGAGGYSNLKMLFQRQVVYFLVEPVYGPELANANPKSMREWFDTYFHVATPDQVAEMPDETTTEMESEEPVTPEKESP